MNLENFTPTPPERSAYERLLNIEDPHTFLGINPGATGNEVMQAYTDLINIYHPGFAAPENRDIAQKVTDKMAAVVQQLMTDISRNRDLKPPTEALPKTVAVILEKLKAQGINPPVPELSTDFIRKNFVVNTFYQGHGQSADNPLIPLSGMSVDMGMWSAAFVASINETEPGVAYINWSGSDIRCVFLPSGFISIAPSGEKTTTETEGFVRFKENLQAVGLIQEFGNNSF